MTAVAAKREARNAWSSVPQEKSAKSRRANDEFEHRRDEADISSQDIRGVREEENSPAKRDDRVEARSAQDDTPAKNVEGTVAAGADTVSKARERALPSSHTEEQAETAVAALPVVEPIHTTASGEVSKSGVAAVQSPGGVESSFDASAELMNIDERMKELQNFLKEAKEGNLAK